MPDLAHLWATDLAWSPTGDLATTAGPDLSKQRLLRRLLTASADYIWHLDYGANLPGFVGQPGASLAIRAAIRGQIAKETAIAQTPAPAIDLTPDPAGILYVNIRYADIGTGATATIAFTA